MTESSVEQFYNIVQQIKDTKTPWKQNLESFGLETVNLFDIENQIVDDLKNVLKVSFEDINSRGNRNTVLLSVAILIANGRLNEQITTILETTLNSLDVSEIKWTWSKSIDHESTNYKSEEEFKRFNEFKLNILHLIVDNYSSYDLNIGLLKNIIIKSSIFSISTIPWSNKSCKEISEKIIQKCLDLNSNLINDDFYINILNNDLKSKIIKIGKSSKITSQGRKKIDNIFNNTKLGYKDDSIYSSDSKDSWKFQCPEVLSSLYWIINKLSSKDINNNWFILIPSILNIIDDYECIIKAYGCLILNQLLSKIDPLFLKRTGLGPIFWESLTNCTAYLPTLTPVSDSIFILNNSLTTLNSLVPILETDKSKQMYLYGETLQNCILRGISHSGENIKIMKTLLNHVQISIHNLQIYSVKYLSQLIEICRSIITDPYNMVDCSLTIQSLKLLNITICNCWPRIKYYQYDIIYTTATAWKQLEREKKSNNNNNYHKDLNIIEKEIKNIINLLKDCCENEEVEETIKIVKGNDRYENFCSGF